MKFCVEKLSLKHVQFNYIFLSYEAHWQYLTPCQDVSLYFGVCNNRNQRAKSRTGGYDLFIEKLDPKGNFIWVERIGGPGWDEGISIAVDNNSHIYTTGYFGHRVDFEA